VSSDQVDNLNGDKIMRLTKLAPGSNCRRFGCRDGFLDLYPTSLAVEIPASPS
jgi:hypothetical protein